MGWEGTGYGEVGIGSTRATMNLISQHPAKTLTTFSKRCFARLEEDLVGIPGQRFVFGKRSP